MASNQRVVLLPVMVYLVMVPVICIWLWAVAYLMSIGTPVYKPNSFTGSMTYDNYIVYLFLFMLFGLIWIIALMSAIEKFTIAATTCMWYFSGQGSDSNQKDSDVALNLGLRWAIFYHLGSLAFGSFLIAVCTMIKIIFEFFAYKAEKSGANANPMVKCFICCARCMIWALDAYIKFMNKNAYIQIALHNNNFCQSA